MGEIEVLEPGPFATVQDAGREGNEALGVPASGALDLLSFCVGNRLVGNPDGAAALELTLVGGRFRFRSDAVVALAGAPMPADVDGRALRPWEAMRLVAGAILRLGRAAWGVRTYLCVGGGIDVPVTMGSRATHVAGGFGGLAGRTLRAGDLLPLGSAPATDARALPSERVTAIEADLRRPSVRAVPGAHAESFDAASTDAFWRSPFSATDRSDRMGARLTGPRLRSALGGRVVTEGIPCGAVQVTPEGDAIVLLADGPTTGGYPAVATVATVDLPRVAQLRPHETISFERVSPEAALAAWRERDAWFAEALPPA